MATTMLSLIQAVRGELGLTIPNAVASSQDTDTKTTLALINALGQELVNAKAGAEPWSFLITEYRFTTQYSTQTGTTTANSAIVTGLTTAGLNTTYSVIGIGVPQDTYILSVDSANQVTLTNPVASTGTPSISFCKTKYALPADYKAMISRTMWDKSRHWEMLGALDSQQWQWLKSGYISTGVRIRYRILDGYFQIFPPSAITETLGYEYISNGWARSVTNTPQTTFLQDTDTCLFPDRVMILGTKLKFFQLKGFDTQFIAADYMKELQIEMANDQPQPILSFAPRPNEILVGYDNIPDGGYGGVVG